MAIMPSVGFTSDNKLVPCCIDNGCADNEEADDEDNDCKICNPLFSCSCFYGFIVSSYAVSLSTTKNMEVEHSFYHPSVPIQLSYSIWQPPKLDA